MKTANQISMNEKQAITFRRLSRVMMWLSTVFLIILQVMGFFVAVNAGYEKSLALALSFVPVLGPFYCVVELFSSAPRAIDNHSLSVRSLQTFPALFTFATSSAVPSSCRQSLGTGFDNPAD